MKEFFETTTRPPHPPTSWAPNKIFLAIVVGALIVGAAVYFGLQEKSPGEKEQVSGDCQNIPELPDGARKLATKIIDGDTFLIEGGYSVRVLGIDADEIGESCYEVAKNRLEELVLDKEVLLEEDQVNQDQYKRFLRYIFLDNQNINLQLIKEGLVNSLFYEPNLKYKEEITEVENEAKINKIGCEWAE